MGGFFEIMSVVMFQGLLHHLFVELVKHVSSVIAREGAYSIEFSVGSHRRTLSVVLGGQAFCVHAHVALWKRCSAHKELY